MSYQLEAVGAPPGEPLGSSARAGLATFLRFAHQAEVASALAARVRLPVQERRSGFTGVQKSLALLAALAAGCQSARDGDFVLKPDPVAAPLAGRPRWPHSSHSSQLTRHLQAFRPQQVAALRAAVEEVTARHATARRRLRRGQQVVVDLDQTDVPANGRRLCSRRRRGGTTPRLVGR